MERGGTARSDHMSWGGGWGLARSGRGECETEQGNNVTSGRYEGAWWTERAWDMGTIRLKRGRRGSGNRRAVHEIGVG